MLTIGLTGGIASGKSTVAKYFAEHHIDIIDTDQIAHVVIEPGEISYNNIISRYGKEVLTKEKKIDRKKLRNIIFNDSDERQWLEKMLHPKIREVMYERIAAAKSPYCIVIIPLLIETKNLLGIDRILVVEAPLHFQTKRLIERDNMTEEEAMKMIDVQVSSEERREFADDLIINDKGISELKQQVQMLHHKYLEISMSS